MKYEKAKKVNDLFRKINVLEHRIDKLEEFLEKYVDFSQGELAYKTMEGYIYHFKLEEGQEMKEITDLILSYYCEEIEKLRCELEEL